MNQFLLWSLAPSAMANFVGLGFFSALALYRSRIKIELLYTLALGIAVAISVFLLCKPEFRVLSDETGFLNLAHSLLSTGKANRAQEWVWLSEKFSPVYETPSFRPMLFPALEAGLGLIFGLGASVAFAVNFFALAILIATLTRILRDRSQTKISTALTALLVGLSPVLMITASSAGYDLLSLAFGALCFLFWKKYGESKSQTDLVACFFAALCFASARVEGVMLFALLWAAITNVTKKHESNFLNLLLAAFLILPVLAQRLFFYPHVDTPALPDLLAWKFIWPNLQTFARAFFLHPTGPFPFLMHWAGLATLVLFGRKWFSFRHWPFTAFIMIYLGFLLAFHDGQVDHPFQARLFLPFSLLLAGMAVSGANKLPQKWRVSVLLLLAVGQSALSYPAIRGQQLYWEHPMTTEFRAVRRFVEEHDSKILYVYGDSGQVAALGRAAIRPWRLDRDRAWVKELVAREKMSAVLLVETLPASEGGSAKSVTDAEKKLVAEFPLEKFRSLRISELRLN